MKAITEQELRDLYRAGPFSRYTLPAGARLTPAAAQFLSERRITVEDFRIEPREKAPDGENVSGSTKKEYQTHLRGKTLVAKNHPRIKFRGQLDHLEAEVIISIIEAGRFGLHSLAGDLQWFLDFSRQVMKAEVTGEKMPELSFGELDSELIRKYSHHPGDYMGVSHFMPEAGHGIIMGRLNLLRTLVRKVELSAVDAFCHDQGVEREDLLTALNRASSVLYIMMCRLLSGEY